MTLKLGSHHMLNKMDRIFSTDTSFKVKISKVNFYLLCLPELEGFLFKVLLYLFFFNFQDFNSKNDLFYSLPPIFEVKYYDTGIYPLFSYLFFFIDYICVPPYIKTEFCVSMWSLKKEEVLCFNNHPHCDVRCT